jgi:type I restriction enzyme S subunit
MSRTANESIESSAVGYIPSSWQVTSIREACSDFINGGTPSTKQADNWKGDIPWITGADFQETFKIANVRRYITKKALNSSSSHLIPKGNILIVTRTGVGKIAIAPFDVAISQDITGLILKKEQFSVGFFFYCLQSLVDDFKKHNQGTSINGIIRKDLEKKYVPCPSIVEQGSIANILSKVDEIIEMTEAAIEKYRAIKAGMIHDLFTRGMDIKTGKLRPSFQEDHDLYKDTPLGLTPKVWEILKIGDFAQIKGGKRMPAGKEFSETITPFPYLRVTDMQDGGINQSDIKYVPREIEPVIRNYKISADDVYVTIAGTLGLFGTIPDNLDNAQLTENAARITEFDRSVYNRDFIKYQCSSSVIQNQVIREIGVGGGVPKLALFRIAKFLFLRPSLEEQEMMVERIRCLDHELESEKFSLYKMKHIKQGLMSDLLTGKVRVQIDAYRKGVTNAATN